MATVDKKYLDLTGLQSLVDKRALVVHPTRTQQDPAAVKVGTDAYGHVSLGNAITASDVGAVPTTRKVNNKPLSADITLGVSDISGAVPTSRTIAGIDLADNITNAELAQALGISGAMNFIGVSTTDPSSSSGATVSGHTSWKKGDVVIYKRGTEAGYEEYIATTDDNAHWEKLGDADDYALKSISVTGTNGLTGGGTLTENRTISHVTYDQATAAAIKVGRDQYGHVVLGSALSIATNGAHTHTVDIAANKVVTAVNTKGYSWSLNKGTDNANVKTVVTDYAGASSHLVTTTVTGVSGSVTASKATAGTAVAVAKVGAAVTYGTANPGTAVTVATLKSNSANIGNASTDTAVSGLVNGFNKSVYHAEYVSTGETLKLSSVTPSTTSVVPAKTSGSTIGDFIGTTSITPAVSSTTTLTPAVSNGSITPYSFTNVTVPVAASATTVATGATNTNGTGDAILTGLGQKSTTTVLSDATTIDVTNPSTGAQATLAYSGTKGAVTGAGTATEAGGHSHTIE